MKKQSEKEYFIQACLSENLNEFYKQYINQDYKARHQHFEKIDDNNINSIQHKYWVPSNICCSSGKILTVDTIDVRISYWYPFIWMPIHKNLKDLEKKQEAYECQKIDSSCNDCKFLDRKNDSCLKKGTKNLNALLYGNTSSPNNRNCFVHRLD